MIVGVSFSGDGNLTAYQNQLHEVLMTWQASRDEKNYEEADRIKNVLESIGVSVRATGDGPQANIEDVSKFDPAKLENLK
jgi:cysteinyl-tRNA synthetase